jgi:hypothetical protein
VLAEKLCPTALHCWFHRVQVRDTVELFSFRRQRKLSLRFLASYLLGLTIQTGAGAAGGAAAAAAAAATSQAAAAAAAGKGGRGMAGGSGGNTTGAVTAAAAAAGSTAAGQQGAGAAGGVLPVVLGGQGHDSIEDAATALALYNVYCKLQVRAVCGCWCVFVEFSRYCSIAAVVWAASALLAVLGHCSGGSRVWLPRVFQACRCVLCTCCATHVSSVE